MAKEEPTAEQPVVRYPLGDTQREEITSRAGKRLSDLTIEAVRAGWVQGEDLSIHSDTLRAQAGIADKAGFPQLAANLRRAAELAAIPDKKVLAVYEGLRPYRLRHDQLLALADELAADYGAEETARYIRQAADAYRSRGLA